MPDLADDRLHALEAVRHELGHRELTDELVHRALIALVDEAIALRTRGRPSAL